MTPLKMLGNFVAIDRTATVGETKHGSIIVPDNAEKPTPFTGMVVACGPDCVRVKVRDRVVYGKYSGGEMVEVPEKYLVVEETKVYAVIE